jgi:hypothetical protein
MALNLKIEEIRARAAAAKAAAAGPVASAVPAANPSAAPAPPALTQPVEAVTAAVRAEPRGLQWKDTYPEALKAAWPALSTDVQMQLATQWEGGQTAPINPPEAFQPAPADPTPAPTPAVLAPTPTPAAPGPDPVVLPPPAKRRGRPPKAAPAPCACAPAAAPCSGEAPTPDALLEEVRRTNALLETLIEVLAGV